MTSAFTIDRVLFAADLSKACEPALRCAASVASRFHAQLYLLHVVPAGTDASGARARPNGVTDERRALAAMSQLRAKLIGAHEDSMLAVLSGDPAERILRKAQDIRADLIVMGGSPRGDTRRSAVTDAVVRRASCPVLTVPLVSRERP